MLLLNTWGLPTGSALLVVLGLGGLLHFLSYIISRFIM